MFGGFNQSINIVVGTKEKKIMGPIIVAINKILRNSENWSLALGLRKCKTNGIYLGSKYNPLCEIRLLSILPRFPLNMNSP